VALDMTSHLCRQWSTRREESSILPQFWQSCLSGKLPLSKWNWPCGVHCGAGGPRSLCPRSCSGTSGTGRGHHLVPGEATSGMRWWRTNSKGLMLCWKWMKYTPL